MEPFGTENKESISNQACVLTLVLVLTTRSNTKNRFHPFPNSALHILKGLKPFKFERVYSHICQEQVFRRTKEENIVPQQPSMQSLNKELILIRSES